MVCFIELGNNESKRETIWRNEKERFCHEASPFGRMSLIIRGATEKRSNKCLGLAANEQAKKISPFFALRCSFR